MSTWAFWDASVLVPLFAKQPPHTAAARKLVKAYLVSAWWGTKVEIVSALTRLRRSRDLAEGEFQDAKSRLDRLALDWIIVEPSVAVEQLALGILEKYPLRAGDALQLAAALEWCENQPAGQVFLTDRRLAEAARSAGFTLDAALVNP